MLDNRAVEIRRVGHALFDKWHQAALGHDCCGVPLQYAICVALVDILGTYHRCVDYDDESIMCIVRDALRGEKDLI